MIILEEKSFMKHIIPIAISACVLCASCDHVYYSPNTANTPLLTKKNEARINGAVSLSKVSEFGAGEIQLAYAFTNYFGLMVNGITGYKSENTDDYEEKGDGQYIEMAPGFFIPISNNKNWIAEIYGGMGKGRVYNDYGLGDHSKVSISKVFVQPAIGYKIKNFEIALSPKISFINWIVKEDQIFSSVSDLKMVDRIKANPKFTAFEPGVILRCGGEKIKVQVVYSWSKLNSQLVDLTETEIISIGFSFNIRNRKNN
jgi:hypothetical protein